MKVFLTLFVLACVFTACSAPSNDAMPTLAQLGNDVVSRESFVQVSPVGEEQRKLLDYWITETSLLSPSKDRDIWQFVGSRGDLISLRVIGYNIQPSMTLQDPDGFVLMEGTGFQAQLERDGVYTVQVTLDQPGDGSYDIGLGYADRPNPTSYTPTPRPQLVGVPTPTPPYNDIGTYVGTLNENESAGNILTDDVDRHVYSFEADSNELVNIKMERVAGEVDPFLTIFAPDGNIIAMDDNTAGGRNAELRNVKLLEAGVYTVQAIGADETYGTYSLSFSRGGVPLPTIQAVAESQPTPTIIPLVPTIGPAMNGNRLNDHTPVVGSLQAGDFAQFSIYAVAGELFTLTVAGVGTNPLRAQIELYGPEGQLIANTNASESNDNGNTIVPAITAPITGAYIIILNGENGSGGDYLISYGTGYTTETIVRGSPPPNTRADGNMQRRGVLDEWHVVLQAGDIINVAVSSAIGAFDPYLELRNWRGELVTGDDNSGGGTAALIQSAQINEAGLYRIQVRDATPQINKGQYTLIWRYINVAPTPTPIPPAAMLMTLDDTIELDTYHFYVFSGLAGQKIRIRVEPKPGEVLDPVAVLLNPLGQQIAAADDSNGTLNPVMELTLTQDGSYTVRVNGYLTSGRFDLYVEQLF